MSRWKGPGLRKLDCDQEKSGRVGREKEEESISTNPLLLLLLLPAYLAITGTGTGTGTALHCTALRALLIINND